MGEALDDAVAALERGGVVVVPTETVYGLAARPDRPEAIARIFELKGRSSDKVLQLLVPGAEWLDRLSSPTETARFLAAEHWPGPLTLVVIASESAPDPVVSDGSVGLRVPNHPIATELLRRGGPLAATSANRSGDPTPTSVDEIRAVFGDGVDVYLDGGVIAGAASTVVDATNETPVILRAGAISI
jgi:tRNA threonylcarbamoyl adenosine modification protein (Sua5/YciO/YrdC/YwlC family)